MKKKSTTSVAPKPTIAPQGPSLESLQKEAAEKFAKLDPNDPLRLCKAFGALVDKAIPRGLIVLDKLPADCRDEFKLVLKASDEVSAGKDEEAKATLQGIGLRSPFLEWKLYLRGLSAYYLRDDARALENWQRLDVNRAPWLLAQAFRAGIDKSFLSSQSPIVQKRLQEQYDALQNPPPTALTTSLKTLMKQLSTEPSKRRDAGLAEAFRTAEPVLAQLQETAPSLVPRFMKCVNFAIVSYAQPEDLTRYAKLFKLPMDHPELSRLSALRTDRLELIGETYQHWKRFLSALDKFPDYRPGELGKRVRAVVWLNLAELAEEFVCEWDEFYDLPKHEQRYHQKPMKPEATPRECYERCLTFAPDFLEAHLALFKAYSESEDDADLQNAIKQGRALLKYYPEHLDTLKQLSTLLAENEELEEALALLERAQRVNPSDQEVKTGFFFVKLSQARMDINKNRFDAARKICQEMLARTTEENSKLVIQLRLAACEFKAGLPVEAEAWLNTARSQGASKFLIDYSMLVEAIRLKLHKDIKKRFEPEFLAGLQSKTDTLGAIAVAKRILAFKDANVNYIGLKTHEKKLAIMLRALFQRQVPVNQIEEMLECMLLLEDFKRGACEKWLKTCLSWHKKSLKLKLLALQFHVKYLDRAEANYSKIPAIRKLQQETQQLLKEMPDSPEKVAAQQEFEKLRERIHQSLPDFGEMNTLFERLFGHTKGPNPFAQLFGQGEIDDEDDDYEDDDDDD